MLKTKKCIFFFILGVIVATTTIVLADYAYNSNNVYYNNSNSTLNSTDVQNALEELDNKCETKIEASGCPEGYKCTEIPYICKRATTLHTETCSNSSSTSNNCLASYSSGGTITYGQLGTSGQNPSAGDAFDCDVTGNGDWKRFYYISTYFDTSTQSFDNDYYVFIYYSNIYGGVENSNDTIPWYYNTSSTTYGPNGVVGSLPKITGDNAWRSDLLKTKTRNILRGVDVSSVTYSHVSNYSYTGAARLLTIQELKSACPGASTTAGSMNNCQYFFEKTRYSKNSGNVYGIWLESVYDNSYAWNVSVYSRSLSTSSASNSSNFGARPVIEIHKDLVSY